MSLPPAVQQPDDDRDNGRRRFVLVGNVFVPADIWELFPEGLAEELTGLSIEDLRDGLRAAAGPVSPDVHGAEPPPASDEGEDETGGTS